MSSDSSTGARALASRQNGARSRGPRTAAGKARVARNALKHGLSARNLVLLDDEDADRFAAFEAAAQTELTPAGEFQAELVARIVTAAWRARRADRLEAALFRRYVAGADPTDQRDRQAAFGLGLVRDGHGPRALETLVRYRGSVLAELFRTLGALKLLQAGAQDGHAAGLPDAGPAAPPSIRAKTKQTRESERKQRARRSPTASSGVMTRSIAPTDRPAALPPADRD